jgi:hypothetical protein
MASFNDAQSRAILCGFVDIHRRMAELECLIQPGARPSPFSQRVNDLSPTEAKVVQDSFAGIRTAMLIHLQECGIALDVRPTSLRWAIQGGISFIGITVDELRPRKLRGYGTLDEEGWARAVTIQQNLERLIDRAAAYLRQGLGRDLSQRLARLEATPASVATLSSSGCPVSSRRTLSPGGARRAKAPSRGRGSRVRERIAWNKHPARSFVVAGTIIRRRSPSVTTDTGRRDQSFSPCRSGFPTSLFCDLLLRRINQTAHAA